MMFPFTAIETEEVQTSLNYTLLLESHSSPRAPVCLSLSAFGEG